MNGHRGRSALIGESYPPPPRPRRCLLPIPDKDTRAIVLAMFVGMYATRRRRRTAARLLSPNKHEGRGGPHAHAQSPRALLGLDALFALAQLVDAEQYAEERQAPEDDTKHCAYYYSEGHTVA